VIKMGLAKNLAEAAIMTVIGYTGIISLTFLGVGFGHWAFTQTGFLVIFVLGFVYSFYFKL